MRELLIAVVVLGVDDAHAEEVEDSVRAQSLVGDLDGPWLHLDDAVLAPGLEAFDATRDSRTTFIKLGPRTRLALDGASWSANLDMRDDGGPGARDIPGHGWRAGLRLSHDFGLVRVRTNGSINHVDTRYGTGTYTDVGLSIGRTHRLSRWMTGWISLGIERRRWSGPPPPGESNATELTLTIGTTFR